MVYRQLAYWARLLKSPVSNPITEDIDMGTVGDMSVRTCVERDGASEVVHKRPCEGRRGGEK